MGYYITYNKKGEQVRCNPPTQPNDSAQSLTKREYFAGLAMQAYIPETAHLQTIIEDAVRTADALIAALNEEKP